jgi:protein arginine kinase activator
MSTASATHRCQFCGAVSTIHLTEIQNGHRREMHLCDSCGRERDLIPESTGGALNLPALLELLFTQDGHGSSADFALPEVDAEPAEAPVDPASLKCPGCGLKYAQFRVDGRFGCPDDYDIFRDPLLPLLEKIHRGLDHAGKVPRPVHAAHLRQELHERLEAAVAAEEYEDAARIRDELKQMNDAKDVSDVTGLPRHATGTPTE